MRQEADIRASDLKRKYVFICGLHRSGTTLLARNIGRMEGCTAFENTGAVEDEGQHLQSVYPPDQTYGGTGRFGFDRRAHLTESSPLLTSENIVLLQNSWHAHWEKKPICVEKTPANLIMTRFLQAAFPSSYFIVIKRHPVAVALATQRWKVNMSPIHRLLDHWLRCYDLFENDKLHLERVFEMKYEDYVSNPTKHHREIAAFLGTRMPEGQTERLSGSHNRKYLDRWQRLLTESPFRSYYRHVAGDRETRTMRHGYSLFAPTSGKQLKGKIGIKVTLPVAKVYYKAAEGGAIVSRAWFRTQWFLLRQLRTFLPGRAKNVLKRVLHHKAVIAAERSGLHIQ